MLKTRSNQKLTTVIILMLCLGAIFVIGVFNKASGQEMVLAYVTSNDPSKCRIVVDKSGEEKPCPYPAKSGAFVEMTQGEAIARGLTYVPLGNDGDGVNRRLANIVDATDWAYQTRVGPIPTPFGERWVVANGRFEVGEIPLKPNYLTETIMLTEVDAKKYGFTIYVPITTTNEAALDELMRVLNKPSSPAGQSQQ